MSGPVLDRWDEADLAVETHQNSPVSYIGDSPHRAPDNERSAIALSYESPLLPTEATAPASASRSV